MNDTKRRSRLAAGTLAVAVLAASAQIGAAHAKELNAIGITVGSLGNPFFTAIARGATAEAQKINPQVKVTTVSSDYDLNKQFTQIDNFIAAGVDMILLNAADAKAIAPAVRKAQAAGIVVVAIDVAAQGADATVTTDNVKAGEQSCQVIADRLHGKGDVVIVNGPQVSAVVDRVKGCEDVLSKAGLKVLSDNQNAQGSRDGGFAVMQGLLTRFPHIDAVFAINDPTAIGASLAAKQLHRSEFFITSVDGAPDIEPALKDPSTLIVESAAQDPYVMAQKSVEIGNDILGGKKPANPVQLLTPTPITPDNLASYKGWSAPR
jgi:ribose transport system substrate-binding protein